MFCSVMDFFPEPPKSLNDCHLGKGMFGDFWLAGFFFSLHFSDKLEIYILAFENFYVGPPKTQNLGVRTFQKKNFKQIKIATVSP